MHISLLRQKVHWAIAIFLCGIYSVNGRPDGRCLLPKVTGPCRVSFPAFFFNSETNRCESFYYGGCQGNENRFDSLKECQMTCHESSTDEGNTLNPSVKSPNCKLEAVAGTMMCAALFQKFTFDYEALECKSYTYGGCGATDNLYDSLLECMGSCVHGDVDAPKESTSSESIEDICNLAPVEDSIMSCFASYLMWTFDNNEGKCVSYIYGGCGGTKNLFDTEEECQSSCPSKVTSSAKSSSGLPKTEAAKKSDDTPPPKESEEASEYICSLPRNEDENKSCFASIPQWTFDQPQGKCISYIYGGCGATKNNFDSEEECKAACPIKEPTTTKSVVKSNQDSDEDRTTPKASDDASIDICSLPPNVDSKKSCFASIPKWTFDKEQGKCTNYIYGGCGATQNNFDSEEECQAACPSKTTPTESNDDENEDALDDNESPFPKTSDDSVDICSLLRNEDENKSCFANIPQWTFDKEMGKCINYIYGGCGATKNNFDTEEECKSACPSREEVVTKSTSDNGEASSSPNPSNDDSDNICTLPRNVNSLKSCFASIPQWTFDQTQGKCISYIYGGCGATKNNFDTEEECQAACPSKDQAATKAADISDEGADTSTTKPFDEDSVDICLLPRNEDETISCFASIPQWTYDQSMGKCIRYIYGGCGATKNNFDSVEACQAACPRKDKATTIETSDEDTNEDSSTPKTSDEATVDICSLPKNEDESKSCLASIPQWTFDKTKGKCISYIYGGCGATKNNFDTEEDCQTACTRNDQGKPKASKFVRPKLCSLPAYIPEEGFSCLKLNSGFTFNKEKEYCEFIEFGGCGETENFFLTVEMCQAICLGEMNVANKN